MIRAVVEGRQYMLLLRCRCDEIITNTENFSVA